MAGVQTLPREVLLDSDGVRIRTPPVAELKSLRAPGSSWRGANVSVAAGATRTLGAAGGASTEVQAALVVPPAEAFDCAVLLLGPPGPEPAGQSEVTTPTTLGLSRAKEGGAVQSYLVAANTTRATFAQLPATVDLTQPVGVRAFMDQGIVESYWSEGRVVMTAALQPGTFGGGIALGASATRACKWASVEAWRMTRAGQYSSAS